MEGNLELMTTLDDARNSQDWETFKKRHAGSVAVYWPGQAEPTKGREAHHKEAMEYFRTFPDNRVGNRPYLTLFGQGDWTCSLALHTGTHREPMMGPGGKVIPPTNRKFQVEFCTGAHWNSKGEKSSRRGSSSTWAAWCVSSVWREKIPPRVRGGPTQLAGTATPWVWSVSRTILIMPSGSL